MPKKGKLTPKQQHFADEWLIDHNGTRAYKVAYSSVKKDSTAKAAASRMLTNVNVNAYIKSKQAEIAAKYEITQDIVIKNIVRLGEKAEDADKYSDALKAQEMLAKHVRLFTDSLDVNIKTPPVLNVVFQRIVDADDSAT